PSIYCQGEHSRGLGFAVLVFSVRDPDRLFGDPDETRFEGLIRLPVRMEQSVECPIFDRLEFANLPFALHDQAHGNGLHATCREAAAYLVPKQWRNLIAHQPVKHTACLLCIDEILIYIASVLESFLHGLLSDLIESDATNFFPLFGVCSK